jgi:hypothetical protein
MYQWTIVLLNPPCNESNPNNKYSNFVSMIIMISMGGKKNKNKKL